MRRDASSVNPAPWRQWPVGTALVLSVLLLSGAGPGALCATGPRRLEQCLSTSPRAVLLCLYFLPLFYFGSVCFWYHNRTGACSDAEKGKQLLVSRQSIQRFSSLDSVLRSFRSFFSRSLFSLALCPCKFSLLSLRLPPYPAVHVCLSVCLSVSLFISFFLSLSQFRPLSLSLSLPCMPLFLQKFCLFCCEPQFRKTSNSFPALASHLRSVCLDPRCNATHPWSTDQHISAFRTSSKLCMTLTSESLISRPYSPTH